MLDAKRARERALSIQWSQAGISKLLLEVQAETLEELAGASMCRVEMEGLAEEARAEIAKLEGGEKDGQ